MNQNLQATILMVTHDPFSASFCKRVLFLKDGHIFNEILKGKNIHNAIKLMLEMDFFKLKIENKYKFFKFICM